MSKPNSPRSYPPEFYELVQKVGLQGHDVTVSFDTKEAATSLRHQFYGFRTALRKEKPGSDDSIAADSMMATVSELKDGTFLTRFIVTDSKALRCALDKIEE